jgi:hypothetical protein
MDIDPEKFICLPTDRLNAHMVIVRRTDCAVKWSPKSHDDTPFFTVEKACAQCDIEHLPSVKKQILALKAQDREVDWNSWGPSLQTYAPGEQSDTSVFTSESEDDGGLHFRKPRRVTSPRGRM